MGVCLYRESYIAAAVIFVVASATDVLDGYIARHYNKITDFGKFFDPLADKLLSLTALVLLAVSGRICEQNLFLNWLPTGLVFVKELLIGVGGLIVYRHKKIVRSAGWYGKTATFLFFVAILFLMIDQTLWLGRISITLALICSVFAFFMYVRVYFRLRQEPETTEAKNGN